MKFVLLDRDGVINFDSDDYIRSADEWLPIPGSIEAIASLSRAGFEVVVVTNQSGLSRGFFGLDELEAMHAKMRALVEAQGGTIGGIYYCRTCRKTTATAASRGPACWTPSSRITVVPWQAASWWETP
jgi:D-glycero-D-manno-heptose 1,7-bisphosphate phosphatase